MKILYVTTISNTMGFFTSHINMLLDEGHKVDMACNLIKPINKKLIDRGCEVYNVGFQRSPLDKKNYYAYKDINEIIHREKYDIIHTHTPIASALVRLACKNKKDTKVFYTAHGFHFHKGAPFKNWLLYFPIEKWLSRYTDLIITINKEDYNRAKSNFKAKNIEYIPGVGLDVGRFKNTKINKKAKRGEIGLTSDMFVILSAGEVNKNKNHEIVIKAIANLKNTDIHYVICGKGPLKGYLEKLSFKLGVNNQVHLLGYRSDIAEIYKASDIFIFPSLREGLGMAALEAMASGLPIITSNIHGIVDYSIDGITGYTCNPTDVEGFSTAIEKLFRDNQAVINFGEHNKEIVEKYDVKNAVAELNKVYQNNI